MVNMRERYASPLAAAARSGNTALIRLLLARGGDPDLPGVNGWTPLLHAIHKNQAGSVRALLDGGVDVNRTTRRGFSTLMMAAGYGYEDIVRLLLARDAHAYAENAQGGNALTAAVGRAFDIDRFTVGACQTATVRALLERAPDLKVRKSFQGRKALATARVSRCGEVLRLLAGK